MVFYSRGIIIYGINMSIFPQRKLTVTFTFILIDFKQLNFLPFIKVYWATILYSKPIAWIFPIPQFNTTILTIKMSIDKFEKRERYLICLKPTLSQYLQCMLMTIYLLLTFYLKPTLGSIVHYGSSIILLQINKDLFRID